jgi:2-polyprenyl-6-methoxyphenol hydroxylase-like FAD-dependent oxidoreductase
MAKLKVIIIGSGLAGSLLANGLIANDIDIAVYDRLKQHGKREGYQIRLGAPALMGMRACLSPEHIERITAKFGRAGGLKSAAPICYSKSFKPLIDLTRFPAYSKSAPISRGILRDALSAPVFDAGKLTYERIFDRFEIVKAGTFGEQVRAWFDDGSYDDCDILIGADGSHSKVDASKQWNQLTYTS